MSNKPQMKKRSLEDERRLFQEKWTEQYCFIENKNCIVCLICNQNISVPKEYNLKRHFETKHKDFNQKFTGELKKQKVASLCRSLKTQQNLFVKNSNDLEQAVEVSFDIANLLVKNSKPFTDGDFVKTCLVTASQKLCCKNCVKNFNAVSLNRMTVQRRVIDISENIEAKFCDIFQRCTYYSLAVDESTDITSTAQMCIFARGVTDDFEIYEELLEFQSLHGQTTGSDLLRGLLQSIEKHGMELSKLVGIVTDGAPAMVGRHKGMVILLEKHIQELGLTQELIKYHCIIHQQNLIGQILGFKKVMGDVVKVVNFIRSRGLNHRQFKSFLDEIEAEHGDLLFYTEVRWLSRGKVLQRFLDLIDEIKVFLIDKGQSVDYLESDVWLCDLAFLTDITAHLNGLNLKLQGKDQFVSHLADNIAAFQTKLGLFHSNLLNNNTNHFPNCSNVFKKYNISSVKYAFHIEKVQKAFEERFEEFQRDKLLVRTFANPFDVSFEDVKPNLQLELIDLHNNHELKFKHKEGNLLNFYKCLPKANYPMLWNQAAICACLFASTYICEQTFSIMKLNKSVHRNRLTDENLNAIMRLHTTNIQPDINHLVSKMQHQRSH